MFKGNPVKNGNCPATVMGAKAHCRVYGNMPLQKPLVIKAGKAGE